MTNDELFDYIIRKVTNQDPAEGYEHDWQGECPDTVNGPDSRDPECPGCAALDRALELLAKLRTEPADSK